MLCMKENEEEVCLIRSLQLYYGPTCVWFLRERKTAHYDTRVVTSI